MRSVRARLTKSAFFAVILTLMLSPGKPLRAAGDLSYPVDCSASISGEADFAIDLELYGDNSLGFDHSEGYGYVASDINTSVGATTSDQTLTCSATFYIWGDYPWTPTPTPDDIAPISGGPSAESAEDEPAREPRWYDIDYAEDYLYLPGAGPGSMNFVAQAFIPGPKDWLGDPQEFWGENIVFNTNARSFQLGGDSKMSLVGDPYNSAVESSDWLFAPVVSPGFSEMYELSSSLDGYPWEGGTRLTQAAKDDWEPWGDKKLQWGDGDVNSEACGSVDRLGQAFGSGTSSIRINCHDSGTIPWVIGAPHIDWDIWITLTFGSGSVAWNLSGTHDGFPSYEVYFNSQAVYTFQTDGNPNHLWGSWGDTTISCGNSACTGVM